MIKYAAIALALLAVAGPAAAADDGFGAFWKTFTAAIAKDDKTALAGMVQLGPGLGDNGASFAKFHAGNLGAKARTCLAKGKPDRNVDQLGVVNYGVFCGPVIYGFTKTHGAWKLTDLGAND